MKKRNNPFTENISITVSSDRAKKKPLCILIKRYLLVFVLLVFAAALSAGTFAGISAYLSVSRLSSTVDDLQMLVAWQASALSEADVMAGAAFSGQAGALDWINLGPITGDEISAETSDDAARMSDPWLEVEATA